MFSWIFICLVVYSIFCLCSCNHDTYKKLPIFVIGAAIFLGLKNHLTVFTTPTVARVEIDKLLNELEQDLKEVKNGNVDGSIVSQEDARLSTRT